MYTDATEKEINEVLQKAWSAFHVYRLLPLQTRVDFMYAIAHEMENESGSLLETAQAETHLTQPRLASELARTVFQLRSYADASLRGDWLEARIDTAQPSRNPPKPDIRKMNVALGPVVVFGASNFPFAYSTAGGDTACAFAAGCPVVVKAHPAHAETSEKVASLIFRAAKKTGMPGGIFAHVHGASFDVGSQLTAHPLTKAVGFTGSFSGGKALFDIAAKRKEPIPVFAEMSSINPVFLLPEKLETDTENIASMYAASITLSVGQFCTNPGLIIGIESDALNRFEHLLAEAMKRVAPSPMLNPGIAKNYSDKRSQALKQEGVQMLATSSDEQQKEGNPTLAYVHADIFLRNPLLHQEVFGPYSLLVRCKDEQQMIEVASTLEGQLTATIIATGNDVVAHQALTEQIKNICGRFILNGVPTGVEVVESMQHGGPFPATTDSRFTSVGSDGIKRFVRPIAFQNWTNNLLPDALRDENPLNIWRTVNNTLSKDALS